jgi:hypothetical protein
MTNIAALIPGQKSGRRHKATIRFSCTQAGNIDK